jgi:hypothetical protein
MRLQTVTGVRLHRNFLSVSNTHTHTQTHIPTNNSPTNETKVRGPAADAVWQRPFQNADHHTVYFLSSFLVWPPLRNHCRCKGILLLPTILRRTRALGRAPLDEESARRRAFYLTTHIYNRQTSMPLAGFQPGIPASERPQTRLRTRDHRDRSVYYRSWQSATHANWCPVPGEKFPTRKT